MKNKPVDLNDPFNLVVKEVEVAYTPDELGDSDTEIRNFIFIAPYNPDSFSDIVDLLTELESLGIEKEMIELMTAKITYYENRDGFLCKVTKELLHHGDEEVFEIILDKELKNYKNYIREIIDNVEKDSKKE
ncbi:hypothetical protein [Carboxydothermus pertinax]|uniref:Uncharacterized protein n=1 Tax=Carboxydothermus pertinax TaxID=870242 RepID=A0A1L8CX99_9THEO|nr:hypothetical protein [Carboxydothermus pertinax]GAV23556.1 hypothetical protein cpu_20660 [Carboxydothermus pertinax]